MSLTIGSLFSGIGGLELGLERAGLGPVVWQVEKDPYCRAVLAKHWPVATRYEDVKDVGRANLAPVDVICGGFPCQDISGAGRRAGVVPGTRSGLWFEYARIVGELRPRYIVVENVSALLVRGIDVVLGCLAELGYDAEWSSLTACAVGAPHARERVFLVAYPERIRCAAPAHRRTRPESHRGRAWKAAQGKQQWKHMESWLAQSLAAGDWDDPATAVRRVAYGIRGGVDDRRIRALGNSVVPQVAEVVGRVILNLESLSPFGGF